MRDVIVDMLNNDWDVVEIITTSGEEHIGRINTTSPIDMTSKQGITLDSKYGLMFIKYDAIESILCRSMKK